MLYKLFTIRDSAANVYGVPFFVAHAGQAMRMFSDECKGDKSVMGTHPEDFELFHIGEYNDENASFEVEIPRSIMRGSDCISPKG